MGFVWSGLPRCAGGVGFDVHHIAFCAILVTLPDLDGVINTTPRIFGNQHYAFWVINTTLRIFGNQQDTTLHTFGDHNTTHFGQPTQHNTPHFG
jgi:hypothetical protein